MSVYGYRCACGCEGNLELLRVFGYWQMADWMQIQYFFKAFLGTTWPPDIPEARTLLKTKNLLKIYPFDHYLYMLHRSVSLSLSQKIALSYSAFYELHKRQNTTYLPLPRLPISAQRRHLFFLQSVLLCPMATLEGTRKDKPLPTF